MGDCLKTEVKELSKGLKLPVAEKESQEICFIPGTTGEFLKKNLKPEPGEIVDTEGNVVGQHKGLFLYTIGQRRGTKIGGAAKPFYVLDKDLKRNLLVVTQKEKDLEQKELVCDKINWISGEKPKLPLKVRAKIRYRHKAASAVVRPYNSRILRVVFSDPQRAITPGQSVVFYRGSELVGGGMIK